MSTEYLLNNLVDSRDALTCTCTTYRLSRLDAILIHGACDCPCHRNKLDQQVTEQAWLIAKARQAKKVSA